MDLSTIPVVEFVEANSTRLIPSAYIEEPALSPLGDDLDAIAFLEELEGLSSSRRGLPDFIPPNVRVDELLKEHHGYGWTYVNAAFCYTKANGNRFSLADRGAWYAAWGDNRVETAQAEVSWHLTQELHATGIYENITSYRELNASFATQFHDLKDAEIEDIDHSDPAIGIKQDKFSPRSLWPINLTVFCIHPFGMKEGNVSLHSDPTSFKTFDKVTRGYLNGMAHRNQLFRKTNVLGALGRSALKLRFSNIYKSIAENALSMIDRNLFYKSSF